jgi:hypothetical protein
MAVRRPDWWCYPERCGNGHEWGPGLAGLGWMCDICAVGQLVERWQAVVPAGRAGSWSS